MVDLRLGFLAGRRHHGRSRVPRHVLDLSHNQLGIGVKQVFLLPVNRRDWIQIGAVIPLRKVDFKQDLRGEFRSDRVTGTG